MTDKEHPDKNIIYKIVPGADRFYHIGNEIYFEHTDKRGSDTLRVGYCNNKNNTIDCVSLLNDSIGSDDFAPYSSILFDAESIHEEYGDDIVNFIRKHGKERSNNIYEYDDDDFEEREYIIHED